MPSNAIAPICPICHRDMIHYTSLGWRCQKVVHNRIIEVQQRIAQDRNWTPEQLAQSYEIIRVMRGYAPRAYDRPKPQRE